MTKSSGTISDSIYKDKTWGTIEKELARTYLKTPVKAAKKKKSSLRTIIPWIVAAVALCAALLAFLFSSNIDIKVRVASSEAFIDKENPANIIPETSVFLVKGGEPNQDLIKSALLLGDARKSSYINSDEITLRNGSGQGWADYKIEFNRPLNLSGLNIRYAAKGETGGERLILMIIDSRSRAFRVESDVSAKLEKGWNIYTINFRPIGNLVDLTEVSALKFEFGALTAGNSPKAAMYIKDVQITRNRRLKWL